METPDATRNRREIPIVPYANSDPLRMARNISNESLMESEIVKTICRRESQSNIINV